MSPLTGLHRDLGAKILDTVEKLQFPAAQLT
jgi:hypothetical protein